MCVVSFIMDHYLEKWQQPQPIPPTMPIYPTYPETTQPQISPAEIAEFRELLEKAREYDRTHNQPDCELEEKRQKIMDLAKELGVEIDFV